MTGRTSSWWSGRASRSRRPAKRSTRPCSSASPSGCTTLAATSPTTRPTSGSRIELGDLSNPTFYLEVPPSLFETVVAGLYKVGLRQLWTARRRGEAVWSRPRIGTAAGRRTCTSTSTSPSSTGSTISSGRWGCRRSSTCGLRTRRSSRSGTATTSPRCRSRCPSRSESRTAVISTTRWARCVTSSSTTSCRWSRRWRWRRRPAATPTH